MYCSKKLTVIKKIIHQERNENKARNDIDFPDQMCTLRDKSDSRVTFLSEFYSF